MKKYRSHKVVEAAPIMRHVSAGTAQDTNYVVCEGEGIVFVPVEFFGRGMPAAGDYLVRYEPTANEPDGYLSWSPKVVFEAGYSEISDQTAQAYENIGHHSV